MPRYHIISILSKIGHHSNYIEIVRNICPNYVDPSNNYLRDILISFKNRRPTLFLMIETHPLAFLCSAIAGSMLKIPVVGLQFRPMEALGRNHWKHRAKGLLMRALRRLPNTSILTILPFRVEPRFEEIASGWIYDFQLWDLKVLNRIDEHLAESLREKIREAANGRKVIIALGALDRRKGFDYLAKLLAESPRLKESFLIVAAGIVNAGSRTSATIFTAAGGLLVDRQLEDGELIGLYGCADMIWSCYSPDTHLASGIYGRAFQLGVPTIVREHSMLDMLAEDLGHATLGIPFDDVDTAAGRIVAWLPQRANKEATAARVVSMMAWSRQVLSDALSGIRHPIHFRESESE